MGQVTEAFLAGLPERGDEPPVRKIAGSIRIDLRDNGKIEYWDLTFAGGKVSVKKDARGSSGRADCHIITDSELFDKAASGQANFTAAALRGAVLVRGDLEMLVLFQRLFPGPVRMKGRGAKT